MASKLEIRTEMHKKQSAGHLKKYMFCLHSRSASGGRRKRSESPKPTKVHVAHLTRNVTKDHISEIFGFFGSIKVSIL
jgi:hypothetical protein